MVTSIRFRQQFFQVRQRRRHDLALSFDAGGDLGRVFESLTFQYRPSTRSPKNIDGIQ